MSRADEIRAQAQRVGSKPSTRSEAGARARKVRATAGPTRTKPVGKTINLDARLNTDLQAWQGATAATLGVSRITFQTTVDALLRELLDDPELAQRIIERIGEAHA